jgi:hypothetical protein
MKQPEFSFNDPTPTTGYERWQEERRAAKLALAQRLGLPLGHEVEVWLQGEVRRRGLLELAEERLFLPEHTDVHLRLTIGHTSFEAGEIESCVRRD